MILVQDSDRPNSSGTPFGMLAITDITAITTITTITKITVLVYYIKDRM